MMNDNTTMNPNSVTPEVAPVNQAAAPVTEEVEDTEEAKLAREAEVGEHDIVIEEDFQINLEVSEVSQDIPLAATVAENQQAQAAPVLGTEQTGSITF